MEQSSTTLWAVMPYLLGEVICWGYKFYECQSCARECVSQRQEMPSKLPDLPGSGTLYKCQERLHLQVKVCKSRLLPKTCRKNLPWCWGLGLVSQTKCLHTKKLKASSEREFLTALSSSPATSRRWRKQKVQSQTDEETVLICCSIDCIDRQI